MNSSENFFLVVPPGFEELAVSELNEKLPGLEILTVAKGGVLVSAPFDVGLAFNSLLKIPTAVRLRIAEFKSRDFPKLFNRIQSVRWNRYLIGDAYDLSVECSASRLLNEKRVEATVRDGIDRFFSKQPPKKVKDAHPFSVHVRFFDDLCTLSLDLSGEPLFKRGYKTLSGTAPIRENLAAALFYSLWSQSRGTIDTLIDPMCGTGTLLMEAKLFFEPTRTREFAFQKQDEWHAAAVSLPSAGPKYFWAFDESEKNSLEPAKRSLAELGADPADWRFETRNVFEGPPAQQPIHGERIAVICNPPYGERIKLPEKPGVYYPRLFNALIKFEPQLMGVVVPKPFTRLWPKKADGYKQLAPLPFRNGGIDVEFLTYKFERQS